MDPFLKVNDENEYTRRSLGSDPVNPTLGCSSPPTLSPSGFPRDIASYLWVRIILSVKYKISDVGTAP
jgi:hypothetical protein